ncbi:Catenin-beta-like protein [Trichophaea hybrida]|nr:Catenin-beta-like protein [Trichophaea hybrida]
MADIDSLFKKPALPGSSSSPSHSSSSSISNSSKKRKLVPSHDPVAAYKSARIDSAGSKAAHAADASDDDDSAAAGPSSLPSDFFDAPAEDEEGGRFFGGGVSERQAEILDFMDEHEKEIVAEPETVNAAWLRKKALGFEKSINKNAEMRGKFEDEPHKFMASEEDLDVEIKAFSILSEHPELFEEFRKLGSLGSLVKLLAHENTDIAIDVVEVISELTDDEVEAEPEQWNALVDGMVEESLLEMLSQNLSRLNEGNESDRTGVYHTLSVFENLASQPSLAETMVKETDLFPWLLKRIQIRESPLSQNKQYAAELLAILLQTSQANRKRITELDAVDLFLQLLSPYRKRDPVKGGDEEEFVENIFDCITCVVDESEGKQKFVEAEGVELALIMLREGKMSKARALRLLDHAVSSVQDVSVAIQVVEAAGLKTLFGMFMKKQDSRTIEHLLGIFASLLRLLPSDSAPRIRTLGKFVENDYAKIVRLLQIRHDYATRLDKVEKEIDEQKKGASKKDREEMEEEWLSKRLDAGLFGIQMIDLILAWLCVEDDGAKKAIEDLLEKQELGMQSIRKTLEESIALMGDDDLDADQVETKDMLTALIDYV